MALSDDQRALLRLLAQREQGYEDIAALKGMSVEEVREEVRSALAEMDSPPLEPTPPEPPKPEPAPEPVAMPKAAEPAAPVRAQRPKAPRPRAPRPALPPERRRLVLVAGGALAIVAIVLGAIAIFGGDSDSGSSSASAGGAGTETALSESAAATNGKVTRAVLEPVDGGEGEGLAVFGRLRKQVRLAIAAKGLEQAPNSKAYVVWLANSSNRMVPVTAVEANESGEIATQYPIPAQVLLYLAEGTFDEIDISLVSTAQYKAAFAQARKENKLPSYTGSDVLRGKIVGPIVNAAQKSGK